MQKLKDSHSERPNLLGEWKDLNFCCIGKSIFNISTSSCYYFHLEKDEQNEMKIASFIAECTEEEDSQILSEIMRTFPYWSEKVYPCSLRELVMRFLRFVLLVFLPIYIFTIPFMYILGIVVKIFFRPM